MLMVIGGFGIKLTARQIRAAGNPVKIFDPGAYFLFEGEIFDIPQFRCSYRFTPDRYFFSRIISCYVFKLNRVRCDRVSSGPETPIITQVYPPFIRSTEI